MFSLQGHRRPHTAFASLDLARFVLATSALQKLIQLWQVEGPGHARSMVPPEISALSFHAPFLVPAPRVAELCPKAPVRAEGNKPRRLFPLVSLQNLLHGTF